MSEREFSMRVRACADRLWRISFSILRCGADCDDALQETLIRAWKGLGKLREPAFFETWLTRILINECKNILRRRGNEQPVPESQEAVQMDNRPLYEAIGALPVKLRIPLVLHYMEGYRLKEIAQMLRLPESTIKWRLYSARGQLRNELSEGEEGHEPV